MLGEAIRVSSEKGETVLDQFGLPRLYHKNRLFTGPGQRSVCAVHSATRRSLFATEWVDPLPGCCMFANGIITANSDSRVCNLSDCFCSSRVFRDPKVFQNCSSRTEGKEKQKEHF